MFFFPKETIKAAGSDRDIFEVEIWSVGPVFRIRANEFDDIGYFGCVEEARAYAEEEFEELISVRQEWADEEESGVSLSQIPSTHHVQGHPSRTLQKQFPSK